MASKKEIHGPNDKSAKSEKPLYSDKSTYIYEVKFYSLMEKFKLKAEM